MFGLVGLGMASQPHLASLRDLSPAVGLGGVWSRTLAKSDALAARWGVTSYRSAQAIAADPRIDAVIIATPPNARRDLVRLFASAGKHVLLEKPIERSVEAAEEIVQLCADWNVRLGVVLQHRFRPATAQLRGLLTSGRLGKVHAVNVQVPWWRDQSYYDAPGRGSYERDGGGVMITQAIHTLDLMLFLLGPVTRIRAIGGTTAAHSMETEDFVAAGLRFACGAIGSLMVTTAAFPGADETIELFAECGSARLGGGKLVVHWRDGQVNDWDDGGGSGAGADPMAFSHAAHRSLIEEFANAVAQQRDPVNSGASAMGVHRFIDAVATSFHS